MGLSCEKGKSSELESRWSSGGIEAKREREEQKDPQPDGRNLSPRL
jgi:hypothetical protein